MADPSAGIRNTGDAQRPSVPATPAPTLPLIAPGESGAPREESLAPTARNEVVVLTDEEGDVTPFGIDELPGLPPGAIETDHVDIVSLTLLETEEAILFQLRNKAYRDPSLSPGGLPVVFAPPFYFCEIDFTHAGTAYSLEIGRAFGSSEFYTLRAGFVAEGEWMANVPAALVATERIEVLLPKPLIAVAGAFQPLAAGSMLDGFEVACTGSSVFFVSIGDSAAATGDDPGTYAPAITAVRPEIAAGFRGHDRMLQHTGSNPPQDEHYARYPMAVPPGELRDARVELAGRSLEAETRVTVSAAVIDRYGEEKAEWSVLAPPAVSISARSVQTVPVLVTAPAEAAHRDEAFLLVHFAIGDDAVSIMRPIIAAWDPAPGRATLYFHGDQGSGIILNTLAADPDLEQGTVGSLSITGSGISVGGLGAYSEMDTPFSERRPLRGAEPLLASLVLSAESEMEAWVRVEVQTGNGDVLGSADAPRAIGPTPRPVELRIDPDLFAYAYEAGERLSVQVGVGYADFVDLLLLTPLTWHLEGSSITLPFSGRTTHQTEENGVRIELAEGSPHILAAASGRVALPITVTNLGSGEKSLNLTGGNLPTDWALQSFPNGMLRLAPEDAMQVCVEVAVPERAGGASLVAVDAMHPDGDERFARLPLTFHVAPGAEIDDTACTLAGSSTRGGAPDLEGTGREASGPAVLFLGALVGLALALRRRR